MISIRLKQDYADIAAGTVLSHHDVVAERWVARGIAEKTDAPAIGLKEAGALLSKVDEAAVRKAVQKVQDEAIAALKKQDAEHKAEIAKLEADAKSAFEMADKATAENADLRKQIADLQKHKAAK